MSYSSQWPWPWPLLLCKSPALKQDCSGSEQAKQQERSRMTGAAHEHLGTTCSSENTMSSHQEEIAVLASAAV